MTCPEQYDVQITGAGATHGLVCDWGRGGAGLKIPKPDQLTSTNVSTKGDYGVRDVSDYWRIVQTDWSEGCGQRTYDRQADSENAFWDSRCMDVSNVGSILLGPGRSASGTVYLTGALSFGSFAYAPAVFRGLSASPYLEYSTDNATWTAITGLSASVTSLTTDGKNLYIVSGGKLWYSSPASAVAMEMCTLANLSHVAYSSGVLYGAVGSSSVNAQVGYFAATFPWLWTALSPVSTWSINLKGDTFGLVSCGNYVYWGITNGTVTKIYKAQYAGPPVNSVSQDKIQEVVSLPHGFIGASLYCYGKTIYIGGHYDSWTSTTTGIGAIYALEDDTLALLTDVGSDPTHDNRVLAISAYEKHLYFVSSTSIWRWNLVIGGYSHYWGPCVPGDLTAAGLACGKDSVWMAAAGTNGGTYVTAPAEHFRDLENFGSAYLTSSMTTGNMPTVPKYFSTIQLQLADDIPAGFTIDVAVDIDGAASDMVLDTASSTATLRVYTIAAIGRRLQYAIRFNGPEDAVGTTTPEVTEVSILFTPAPTSSRTYTYFVRCWEKVEGSIKDVLWDENPQVVSDWLESIANTLVTVERPGRASFVGKVDNVEYLEAPPSRRANGREGLYQIDVRRL